MREVARTNTRVLPAPRSPPFIYFIFSGAGPAAVRWGTAVRTDTAPGHGLPRGQAVAKTSSHVEFLFSLI